MDNSVTLNMVHLLVYLLLSPPLTLCYSIQDNQASSSSLTTEDETRKMITKWLVSNKNIQSALNNQLRMALTSSGADSSPDSTDVDLQQVEFEKLPVSINGDNLNFDLEHSSCQPVQIVHLLHHTGCQPKAIVSFACTGSCPSYVQVSKLLFSLDLFGIYHLYQRNCISFLFSLISKMSSSKFWQYERSCSCCQQTGLQEATFTLDCPSLDPPFKKVCMFKLGFIASLNLS